MVKFNQWIRNAQDKLREKAYDASQVEWLVTDMLGWSRTAYFVHQQDEMTEDTEMRLNQGLTRLLEGEPVQYVVGSATFLGRPFTVNEHVLIPRPETEEVVMCLMKQLPTEGYIADIGTGSGVIAVTIKSEYPHLNVIASDISEEALSVAKSNTVSNRVNVDFLKGDTLHPYIERGIKLDGLISNPPYIDVSEATLMSYSTLTYEPHMALFADENGLKIYRAILEQLPKVMNEHAPIVFEIGYQQGEKLKTLITAMYAHLDPVVYADINGHDRIVTFKWKTK